MEGFVITSFATKEGNYDKALEVLENSCKSNNLETDFEIINSDFHSDITLHKPTFIKKKLQNLNCPVVWIDADALVLKSFSIPSDKLIDVGTVPNTIISKRYKNPKNSFIIAFWPNENALHFLNVWEYLCKPWITEKYGDHRRFNWTRHILNGLYSEVNLQNYLAGCIKRDIGKKKESGVYNKRFDKMRVFAEKLIFSNIKKLKS